jgi:hypothetical protein
MKKALAIVLLSLVPAVAAAQTWFAGSWDEALAQAKASGKPVLVDFYVETG